MEKDIYFERCMDFMAKMIEKYGNELLADKDFQECVKNLENEKLILNDRFN